ncbi:endonuclease/exonuclease/phosphatase family protein [Spirillospora sp. NPDC127200]
MTELQIDYFNWAHFGRRGADYLGNGGDPDYTGLIAAMSVGTPPAALAIGEGDRARDNGGQSAWEACAALRAAGFPPYQPLWGSLSDNGGPFAPLLLVDPNQIIVHQWYDDLLPDAAERTRNLLIASPAAGGPKFRLVVVHLDIHTGEERLREVRRYDRFSRPDMPTILIGDFNSTPSGPAWNPDDLNDPNVDWQPMQLTYRALPRDGADPDAPLEYDNRAMDHLVGRWRSGQTGDHGGEHRVGGLGYRDVAELADDDSPTQFPRANGSAPRAVDRIVVNEPAAQAIVPGSYRVYDPPHPDPVRRPSDHKRIGFTVDL